MHCPPDQFDYLFPICQHLGDEIVSKTDLEFIRGSAFTEKWMPAEFLDLLCHSITVIFGNAYAFRYISRP